MCMTKYVRFSQTQPLEPNILGQLMKMIDEFLRLKEAGNQTPTKEILPALPVHYEAPTALKEKNNERTQHSTPNARFV
jgi:hypothetical protein